MSEIQMQSLSSNASSNSSVDIVDPPQNSSGHQDFERNYPFRKSVNFWLLTFLRQNYLKVFSVLVAIIILLIVIMFSFYRFSPPDLKVFEIIGDEHDAENQGVRNLGSLLSLPQVHAQGQPSGYAYYYEYAMSYLAEFEKIQCRKIKCPVGTPDCRLKNVEYEDIKFYSCCNCLPSEYQLVRYENWKISGSKDMILRVQKDISKFSEIDIRHLPPLPNVSGAWDVVAESQTAFYLAYTDMETIPDDDDEADH